MEMKIEPLALPGVDTQRPIVIAGPCSAETEEQVLETAQGLASRGVKIFRAGIWKPRTKPGGFEGIGAEGLAWLKKVKKETGMLVSTEVATKDHVFEALKAGIDILWIGARTTVNPFAVQEIADALKGVDVPVLIKNPVNPDLELWIGDPSTILFYNSGAYITCEESASIEDLKSLEAQGVEILTCGTCLNFYELTDKLQVGEVTNMYVIAEKMTQADLIVQP